MNRNAATGIVIFTILLLALLSAPAQQRKGNAGRHNDPRLSASDLRVGDKAPDVRLARLDPPKADNPAMTATSTVVRLSSFIGRKPVVLVFSSYT